MKAFLLVLSLVLFGQFALASEAPDSPSVAFKIEPQALGDALNEFAHQSGMQLMVNETDIPQGKTTPRVEGELSPEVALQRLLAGSGLKYEFMNKHTVAIGVVSNGAKTSLSSEPSGLSSVRVAQTESTGGDSSASGQGLGGQGNTENAAAVAENGELDEVIVTATKRIERLQDTALSITAIGDAEIQRRNLSGMEDYLASVPGVSLLSSYVGLNNLVVRGIAADPEGEAAEGGSGPSVGIYFGEVPLAGLALFGGASDLRMVDMKRTEVLRGPQGTLFGASSLSGTVRNIPNEPNLKEIEGRATAGYSATAAKGDDNHKFEGVINFPIVEDVLAVRAVAYRHSDSGFVDNVAASTPDFVSNALAYGVNPSLIVDKRGVGDVTYTGGRIAALWQATDKLKISLQYARQDDEQDGFADIGTNSSGYTQTHFQFTGIDGVSASHDYAENKVDISNLIAGYDLGWGELLSSSSWVNLDGVRVADLSSLVGGLPVMQDHQEEADTFSQEVRLVSRLDGPFQFLGGLYYEDIDKLVLSPVYVIGDIASPLNFFNAPFGTDTQLVADLTETYTLKQKAVFGELYYDITDQLELTVGGRWFDYDRSTHQLYLGAFGDTDTEEGTTESGSSYKANLSYKPSEDALLYAQWAEGFRLGNIQFPAPPDLCDTDNNGILDGTNVPIRNSFDSDFLENFEIGGKFQVLGGRMQLNASVYRMNWTGIPIAVQSPVTTCAFQQRDNAGKAISQGVELETVYRITSALRVNISGSYVNAELEEDAPTLGGTVGDRLPGSPEYNLHLGAEYGFEILGHPSYIRGDYSYVGGFFNNLQQLGLEAGNYGQVNLNAGAEFNGFDVRLSARNVTNEDDVVLQSSNGLSTYQLRPRTIGISLSKSFGR